MALDTGSLDAPSIVASALARGLLVNAPRPQTLRFMPALTVSEDEITRMLAILDEVLGMQQP